MKNIIISLSLMTIFNSSAAWAAAPVANLVVTGDIKPPTCTVNGGDNNLLYNLGAVSPSLIPQDTTYNGLPSISNQLTVTCDAETFLTFQATDHYPNPFVLLPNMNINFEANTVNLVNSADTTQTMGWAMFNWFDVTVDGNTAYLSRANNGRADNGVWTAPTGLVVNATNGWTSEQQRFVAPAALNLLSGKEFSAKIRNQVGQYNDYGFTVLYSKSMLAEKGIDISDGVDYTGQVLLTFNFGV